jgi:hypothetical protein
MVQPCSHLLKEDCIGSLPSRVPFLLISIATLAADYDRQPR